jgi:hypothetical protein
LTDGVQNVVIGTQAVQRITTGSNNTIVGYRAGRNLETTSARNIILGSEAFQQTGLLSNVIYISAHTGTPTGATGMIVIGTSQTSAQAPFVWGENGIAIGSSTGLTGTNAGVNSIAIGNTAFARGRENISIGLNVGNMGFNPTGVRNNNFMHLLHHLRYQKEDN